MIEIIQENNEKNGAFVAKDAQTEAGRMTYTWAGKDKFIIDHTEVNEDFNGQGIGKKLLLATVTFAREQNLKVIPLCPFAKSVFDKDSTLRDVLF